MELTPKQQILAHMQLASQELGKASLLAMSTNPMSNSVPVLKDLMAVSQKVNLMMQDISKLPGLDKCLSQEK